MCCCSCARERQAARGPIVPPRRKPSGWLVLFAVAGDWGNKIVDSYSALVAKETEVAGPTKTLGLGAWKENALVC